MSQIIGFKLFLFLTIISLSFNVQGVDTLYIKDSYNNKVDSIKIMLLKNEAMRYFNSDNQYSLLILDEALSLPMTDLSRKDRANVIKFAAYGYLNSTHRKRAFKLLKQAESEYIAINNNTNLAFIYNMFFLYYNHESKDDSVIYYYQKAVSTLRLNTDKSERKYNSTMSIINSNIGNFFFFSRNEMEEARNHYDTALYYAELCHDTMSIAASYSNIGMVLKTNKKYDEAKENYEKAYQMSLELGNLIYAANILGNLGDLYDKQGDKIRSKEYKIKAFNLFKETGSPVLIFKSERILAEDYLDNDEFIIAKSHFINLVNDTFSIPLNEQIALFSDLTALYKSINNTDSALYFHEIYSNLSMRLQRLKNFKATEELIITHKTEQTLKENQLLSIKYKVQQKRHYLLILVAVVLFLIILLLFFIINQRRKLQLARRREIEIENNLLREKLEFKNKELTISTMNLIRHSEFVRSLVPELKELYLKEPVANKNLIGNVVRKINMHNKTELWDDFYKSFSEVNSSFNNNLMTKHPDLSSKERRLCALLKLDMSTKDIASISHISIRGLETARHRLRKKLKITSNINLSNYLQEF